MTDAKQGDGQADILLIVKQTVRGSQQRVFEAWTQPELMKKWFAPTPEFTIPSAEVDLRVGGAYRIVMQSPKDKPANVTGGIYREIHPYDRLSFTWTPEGAPWESLVTIEFRDLGESTEVILTHERLPDASTKEMHSQGWTGCLTQLASYFK